MLERMLLEGGLALETVNFYEYKSGEQLVEKLPEHAKVDELYDRLKAYGFAYAHNSYIVNLRYVKRISATELELQDNVILSISRSKEKNFRADFAKYLAGKYI